MKTFDVLGWCSSLGVLAEFSSLSRCISYVTLVLASSGPSCLAEGTSGNAFG